MSTPEGTIDFWVKGEQADWATNGNLYYFPTVSEAGLTIECFKAPGGRISIAISGIHGRTFEFSETIPPCEPIGLFVCISWTPALVTLGLNDKAVSSIAV